MAFQAKRKFPRVSGREAVRIRSSSGVEYATFEDISSGGLRLWLEHPIKVGDLLELEFDLPSDWVDAKQTRSMRRPARVVRAVQKGDSYEIGVQFLDAMPEISRHLGSAIDDQAGPF